ncbi:MAG: hypothetical protein A3G01_03020 [Candidatus Kerfeldbacteria bacterium RIFCSPLOWO2_12_FULL_43_9]|nr:MAG: hypothetical protein A3G01_03020 [Candidatus Kerfeldbacteria bacterium RIFCSPLOWO2_12_FULL_43_9]
MISVELLPGLPLIDGNTTLAFGKTWSFETGVRGQDFQKYYQQGALLWQRPFYEFSSTFAPAFDVLWYPQSSYNADDVLASVAVSVWKLSDVQFQQSMLSLFNLPDWSKYQRPAFTQSFDTSQIFEEHQLVPQRLYAEHWFVSLPRPLPRGLYAVQAEYNGERQFALVQSTDVSAYTHQSATQNIIWAHNSRSGNPLGGAEVTFFGFEESLILDREGLGTWNIPSRATANFLMKIVDAEGSVLYIPERAQRVQTDADAFWKFTAWDKPAYAASETLQVWGALQPRRSSPSSVNASTPRDPTGLTEEDIRFNDARKELALVAVLADTAQSRIVFDTQTISLSSQFTFQGELRMPEVIPTQASFFVEIVVDEQIVASEQISLRTAPVQATDFSITLEASKYGVVSSTEVSFVVNARYADSTPVQGLLIYDRNGKQLGITNASGVFSFQKQLFFEGPEPFERQEIVVKTSPYDFFVEPFAVAYIDVYAGAVVPVLEQYDLKSGQLELVLSAYELDFTLYPRPLSSIIDSQQVLPLSTKRLARKPLRVDATFKKPVNYNHDTAYDVLQKTSIPVQDVTVEVSTSDPDVVYTDVQGEARLLLPYDTGSIDLRLLAKDNANRSLVMTHELFADTLALKPAYALSLETDAARKSIRLHEVVQATFKQGNQPIPDQKNANILFVEENETFQKTLLKNTSDYLFTLLEDHIPAVRLSGVLFDGVTYTEARTHSDDLQYDASSRKLEVRLTSLRTLLAPSEQLTVEISVTDASDAPKPASIFLFISDSQLSPDVLSHIFQPFDADAQSRMTYRSHQYPTLRTQSPVISPTAATPLFSVPERMLAQQTFVTASVLVNTVADIKTDATLILPEREGEYFLHAQAWSPDGFAGTQTMPLEVFAPFRVDFGILPQYFVGDTPQLRLNATGRLIPANQPVTFKLDIPLLNIGITLQGETGTPVYARLGELPGGVFEAVLEVDTGEYREKFRRMFEVVPFSQDDTQQPGNIPSFLRTYFLLNGESPATLPEGSIVFVELHASARDNSSESNASNVLPLSKTQNTNTQDCALFVETLPSALAYLSGSFVKQYHPVPPESAQGQQLTFCHTWGDAFGFGYYARVVSAGEFVNATGTKSRVEAY